MTELPNLLTQFGERSGIDTQSWQTRLRNNTLLISGIRNQGDAEALLRFLTEQDLKAAVISFQSDGGRWAVVAIER